MLTYRNWKHHLRLKGMPKVKSAKQLGELISGVVVLYWCLCLLGMRNASSNLVKEVTFWASSATSSWAWNRLPWAKRPL